MLNAGNLDMLYRYPSLNDGEVMLIVEEEMSCLLSDRDSIRIRGPLPQINALKLLKDPPFILG